MPTGSGYPVNEGNEKFVNTSDEVPGSIQSPKAKRPHSDSETPANDNNPKPSIGKDLER